MNEALTWAIYSFKCRAMTVTSDQLQDEVDAIIFGQARISASFNTLKLIYVQDETPDNFKKLRHGALIQS